MLTVAKCRRHFGAAYRVKTDGWGTVYIQLSRVEIQNRFGMPRISYKPGKELDPVTLTEWTLSDSPWSPTVSFIKRLVKIAQCAQFDLRPSSRA